MLPRAIVLAAMAAVGTFGVAYGTRAVGGSDSSCYALMAQAVARGELQPRSPLALEAPWPDAETTLAPGGFVPSPVRPGAASPICAPGFALWLAPLYAIGGRDAIFLLTPLAGALLILTTYVLGRSLAGAQVGAAAAVVVASMPVLLFQVVQPMNDVLVALLWTAVLVTIVRHDGSARGPVAPPAADAHRRHTLSAVAASRPRRGASEDRQARRSCLVLGALTGLAILVRLNLAPAGVVVAAWCLSRGGIRGLVQFGAVVTPYAVLVAWLNSSLYGGPLLSGYGAARELFSPGHVAVNASQYADALWRTQLGLPLLGVMALLVAPRSARVRVRFLVALCAVVAAVYLAYRPFPEWWYLRFLLPALPAMTVLALASVVWVAGRQWPVWVLTVVVSAFALTSPEARDAFELWRGERRFRVVGDIARERLPSDAAFITVWNSGSVRYHADREAVLWDSLEPAALDGAIEWLHARGHDVYVIVEEWEAPAFRARFEGSASYGALDWPPRFRVGAQVHIYAARDREPYLRGESVATEQVRSW